MYQPGLASIATPASGGGGAVYLCRAAACAAPLCSVSPGLVPASHCSMVPTLLHGPHTGPGHQPHLVLEAAGVRCLAGVTTDH